ncbi:TerD family protein [Bacillus massilinigeriensis]|uniref:TerD family protein n=1 Tax=Bacillus mediterraneensis TaxID=1805474 RepID=UPI0008F800BB|nr:TerD family protein [Bacillus mediterraneensis]
MTVQLKKGGYLHIGREGTFIVGLGWDPIRSWRSLLMEKFLGVPSADIDCDASVLMLEEDGMLHGNQDVIHYGNLKSVDEGIKHTGDNLSGIGSGDDEQILVTLDKITPRICKLVFVVNIYNSRKRKHHFGMLNNAYIRIAESDNNKDLVRYSLTEDYSWKTSLIVGELERRVNGWRFTAVGEGMRAENLKEIADCYI